MMILKSILSLEEYISDTRKTYKIIPPTEFLYCSHPCEFFIFSSPFQFHVNSELHPLPLSFTISLLSRPINYSHTKIKKLHFLKALNSELHPLPLSFTVSHLSRPTNYSHTKKKFKKKKKKFTF
jgi:hypothetical protein